MPALVIGAPEPQLQAELAGGHHADAHGFAMEIGAVAAEGFHHVAEGVAVIEDRPQAPFPFIRRDDLRLGGGGALQDALQERCGQGRHRTQTACCGFQFGEELRVSDDPVLDYLGHAGPEFPLRQGGQGGGINQDQLGLVEGPDQVLAAGVIHAGFAAD